jgi:hypothetical protein
MKGSQESLTTAVVKDAANWRTPTAEALGTGKHMDSADLKLGARVYNKNGKLMAIDLNRQVEIVARQHGQAAPASSSSLGSRQGLWQTPKATNADCPVIHNPQRSDGGQPNLAAQMVLEQQRQALWLTPRANEPTGDSTFVTRNGDRGQHCSPSLTIQVEKTAQWGTPAANDANKQNVMCEVNSKQAGLPKSVGLELQRQWATPRNCGGPDYAKTTRPSSQSNSLSLPTQVAGKLNPRWVETLMGLPIGWTMPSCTSPQTIEPMSYDSLAMELCRPPQSELSEFSLAS